MSEQLTSAGPSRVALGPNEGHHLHFLNHLATVKVAAGDNGSMSVVEFLAPKGFGPPLHRHSREDELFVVLDGELVIHSGEDQIEAIAGAVAMLPRAIPHTFQVRSDTARFLSVATSPDGVPRFDQMVTALGVDAPDAEIPAPSYIDPGQVAEVCAAHGIDIVGPPPAPLD